MKVEVACLNCGTILLRRPSQNAVFCSPRCKGLHDGAAQRRTAAARFWARVKQGTSNECWPWTGNSFRGGGRVSWNNRIMLTHRVAMGLTDGDWDSKLAVCHTCDNPICCNPAHLWRGTQNDNMQDMIGKKRQNHPAGEAHQSATITEEQVRQIRAATGRNVDVAKHLGISRYIVVDVRRRHTWRHIP